jgi:hypothetical protein
MAGQLTIDTLKASSGVLATQNGMTGIAKAWVNFDGGSSNTAGVINASFNVSSITVNGGGDYTVNFTTAMPSTNYSVSACSGFVGTGAPNGLQSVSYGNPTTTSLRIGTVYVNGSLYNFGQNCIAVFA